MSARGASASGFWPTALVFGSIWGLGEATLGHLLHIVRVPGLPGLVMIPFAVAVMGRAAARSRSAAAVFLAGVAAASFKLFDLFVPGTDLLALSRPIQAILLEALAGAVWVKLKMGTIPFSPSRDAGALPVLPVLLPYPGFLSRRRGILPRRSPSVERGPAGSGVSEATISAAPEIHVGAVLGEIKKELFLDISQKSGSVHLRRPSAGPLPRVRCLPPGGRGARGISRAQPERGFSRKREKNPFPR